MSNKRLDGIQASITKSRKKIEAELKKIKKQVSKMKD